MSIRSAIFYYGPAVLIAAGIFIFSSISDPSVPDLGFSWQDKIYHSLAYFVFGLSLIRAVFHYKKNYDFTLRISIFFGILYGIADEIHQAFVPGRNSSIGDMAANALGVLLAAAFALFYKRKAPDTFYKFFN